MHLYCVVQPMSEVAATERQALLQKVRWCIHTLSKHPPLSFLFCFTVQARDMYYATPRVSPGLDFYKDVFSTLMKCNDV